MLFCFLLISCWLSFSFTYLNIYIYIYIYVYSCVPILHYNEKCNGVTYITHSQQNIFGTYNLFKENKTFKNKSTKTICGDPTAHQRNYSIDNILSTATLHPRKHHVILFFLRWERGECRTTQAPQHR
ncbi:hypothetical protein, unlikely [Trypanosoma brucei gambiense DAL972]|uniref:Uncharacterized protein n=1 Tax=Trypanosoma brucei gambiense (strain MHOM/CI/86/DAL972) TaxID=679716 RepID=C9ZTS0_TRYB9|nr:hypothetical protein, unlikely [Trypanosoma brucei gambiense DAL972]CBH12805.1 hypothetical protein, unlikely [Trypanosoma brucei gambiense DAL972]|eukprot:XP_011775085.1 hypothetical protein, unlikely [Trypanosoma brucei gambiense DAL972]